MDDNTSAVLELDGERTVTFRDRGHAYTYTFSRIGAAIGCAISTAPPSPAAATARMACFASP
jgi:hypothetical protein